MTQFNTGIDRTFIAGEDLTQYTIVKLDTSNQNQVLEATAGSDPIAGVVTGFGKDGSENDAVQVQKGGFSTKVLMSASCNIGDWITATTGGKGIATTTDHANVIGRALEAASEDGDLIEVELIPGTLSHS